MPYAKNKRTGQPAHPRILISAFAVRFLDSRIPILAKCKHSTLTSFCSCADLFESYLVENPHRRGLHRHVELSSQRDDQDRSGI